MPLSHEVKGRVGYLILAAVIDEGNLDQNFRTEDEYTPSPYSLLWYKYHTVMCFYSYV